MDFEVERMEPLFANEDDYKKFRKRHDSHCVVKSSLEFYEEGNTLPNNYYVGDPIPWEYLSDVQKAEYNEDLGKICILYERV